MCVSYQTLSTSETRSTRSRWWIEKAYKQNDNDVNHETSVCPKIAFNAILNAVSDLWTVNSSTIWECRREIYTLLERESNDLIYYILITYLCL